MKRGFALALLALICCCACVKDKQTAKPEDPEQSPHRALLATFDSAAPAPELKADPLADAKGGLFPIRYRGLWGYIDNKGRVAIEPKFDYALNFSEGLASAGLGDKAGYIDNSGEFRIKPEYDRCETFSDGVGLAHIGRNSGYINHEGQFVFGPDERLKTIFRSGVGVVANIQRYGEPRQTLFVNSKGEITHQLSEDVERLGCFSDGVIAFRRKGLWGYMDANGVEIIPPVYEDPYGGGAPGSFNEGYAVVTHGQSSDRYFTVIDKKGREVFTSPSRYVSSTGFSDGLIRAHGPKGLGFLDRRGEWAIEPSYQSVSDFFEGRALVEAKGAAFVIDKKERRIQVTPEITDKLAGIPRQYSRFENGLAAIQIRRQPAYLNVDGTVVERVSQPGFCASSTPHDFFLCLKYQIENPDKKRGNFCVLNHDMHYPSEPTLSEGLMPMQAGSLWGYADGERNEVIPPEWDEAFPFSEGLARVKKDGHWAFINRKGEDVGSFTYEIAHDFHEGLAAVKLEGKWGYVNQQGQMQITPAYAFAADFSEGLALVESTPSSEGDSQNAAMHCFRKLTDEEGPLHYSSFSGDDPGIYMFIDKQGKAVIEEQGFLIAGSFHSGRAPIVRRRLSNDTRSGAGEHWDYIDKQGNLVTDLRLERATQFSNGKAFVMLPGAVAYINTDGELVWPPTY